MSLISQSMSFNVWMATSESAASYYSIANPHNTINYWASLAFSTEWDKSKFISYIYCDNELNIFYSMVYWID